MNSYFSDNMDFHKAALLMKADVTNLRHSVRGRLILLVPYIFFLFFFGGVIYRISMLIEPYTASSLQFFLGYIFHFMLIFGIIEGFMGSSRLIVKTDIDIIYSLPIGVREKFLTRFLLEIIVELFAIAPFLFVFISGLSTYLGITGIQVLQIICIFSLFYLCTESIRYLVDMLCELFIAPLRRKIISLNRLYVMGTLSVLAVMPIIVGLVPGNASELVRASFVDTTTNFYFLPSSAAATVIIDVIASNYGEGFIMNILILLFDALLLISMILFLSVKIYNYEFVSARIHRLLHSIHVSGGGGVQLPQWMKKDQFYEVLQKDLLLFSRLPMYQLQVFMPFTLFLILLAFNHFAFHLFLEYPIKIRLFAAIIFQFYAVWFSYMPAAEFAFSIERKNGWLMRILPLSPAHVVLSKQIAILLYNGVSSFVLCLLIVLHLTEGIYAVFALSTGIAYILYSTTMAIYLNLLSPAHVSRFQTNPVATVLFVAQFFISAILFGALTRYITTTIFSLVGIAIWGLLMATIMLFYLAMDAVHDSIIDIS